MKLKSFNYSFLNLFVITLLNGFLLVGPERIFSQNPVNQNDSKYIRVIPRDGKLLRSELWQPFDTKKANGDFFVSPKGDYS